MSARPGESVVHICKPERSQLQIAFRSPGRDLRKAPASAIFEVSGPIPRIMYIASDSRSSRSREGQRLSTRIVDADGQMVLQIFARPGKIDHHRNPLSFELPLGTQPGAKQ